MMALVTESVIVSITLAGRGVVNAHRPVTVVGM